MLVRYRQYGCFLIAFLFSQIVSSESLSTQIESIIEQKLPHATIGILVKDAQTDRIVYSKNANKLLSPASSMKLFTAAAALYQLKPTHRFLTKLSKKNQNYYVAFSGSPSLTIQNLNHLLLNLKKNGVNTINGNIVLDASRFKAPYHAGGVSYDDLGWYYTAPDTAVILNGNAVTYEFISAKTLGMPVKIKSKNQEKWLNIINQLITVSNNQAKDHCSLNIEIKSNNTLRLFGCLAKSNDPKTMQLAVPDPGLLAKQVIKKFLNENGILLKGHIINGSMPSDATPIASLKSVNLTQLITHMLKESDNLYASSLTKELAYSFTQEGTSKQGAFAIKKILAQHTKLDMTQIGLYDGIGTRYNLVSPEQMVSLLTHLYHEKDMHSIFLKALPQAGVSGTLKDRMKKTALEKKVFAKTGTMHDISSLSGYLIDQNNNTLIFSIIINGINSPISTAKSLEDQILFAIANKINVKKT